MVEALKICEVYSSKSEEVPIELLSMAQSIISSECEKNDYLILLIYAHVVFPALI